MPGEASTLTCAGCGTAPGPPSDDPYPFRCRAQREGDDIDHVIRRTLDAGRLRFPIEIDENPFRRYRELLHSWQIAAANGMSDAEYVTLVDRLDRAIAALEGRGLRETPFFEADALGVRLGFDGGSIWVKDETGNVGGSHKARHLVGVMLYLQVVERLGLAPGGQPALAVASCGNAALAAAVVASAAGMPLRVFVPPDAEPAVLERLRRLDAEVVTCARQAGVRGDPAYRRFRLGVNDDELLPFTCQGTENGLTIEGGETLTWEIISALGRLALDRVFVQVGGGALASACTHAYLDARSLGEVDRLPRVHLVQTSGVYPLLRAYERAVAYLEASGDGTNVDLAMLHARTHRSQFMWPWESEPRSLARGILDDETHDWAACVEGMLRTGGTPVIVSEALIAEANTLARETTGIDVDYTGSAGLAGLMQQLARDPSLRSERVAVIFSGVRRGPTQG
jgi:threonine synthase